MTINAFHPAYVSTFMPEFLTDLQTQSRMTKNGQALTKYIEKARETRPSLGTVFGISNKVVSAEPKQMMRTRSQMMSKIVADKRKTNKAYGTALPTSKNIPASMPTNMKGKKK
jgi:hypothetical protein